MVPIRPVPKYPVTPASFGDKHDSSHKSTGMDAHLPGSFYVHGAINIKPLSNMAVLTSS